MRRSGSGMPTRPSHSIALARAAAPRSAVCASIASTICAPTFITGFRLVAGSWKIMPMRPPRTARMPASGSASRSSPSSAHVAADDAAVLGQQAHQRERRHALAAAGFADQREGLAALDRQRQAVDGLDEAGVGVERHLRGPAISQRAPCRRVAASARSRARRRRGRNARARGSNASRTPSANRLAASTSVTMKPKAAAKLHQTIGSRAHLAARQVDHAAEAVHRRIDADADVRQHGLVEDQVGEARAPSMISTRCIDVGHDVARHDARGG